MAAPGRRMAQGGLSPVALVFFLGAVCTQLASTKDDPKDCKMPSQTCFPGITPCCQNYGRDNGPYACQPAILTAYPACPGVPTPSCQKVLAATTGHRCLPAWQLQQTRPLNMGCNGWGCGKKRRLQNLTPQLPGLSCGTDPAAALVSGRGCRAATDCLANEYCWQTDVDPADAPNGARCTTISTGDVQLSTNTCGGTFCSASMVNTVCVPYFPPPQPGHVADCGPGFVPNSENAFTESAYVNESYTGSAMNELVTSGQLFDSSFPRPVLEITLDDFCGGNASVAVPDCPISTHLWTGVLTVPSPDVYTFTLSTDELANLYIGDLTTPLISNPGYYSSGNWSTTASLRMTPQTSYQFELYLADDYFWSSASLVWQGGMQTDFTPDFSPLLLRSPKICVPCGTVGERPCPNGCDSDIVNPYIDANGLCQACDTLGRLYSPSSPAAQRCRPCGDVGQMPCAGDQPCSPDIARPYITSDQRCKQCGQVANVYNSSAPIDSPNRCQPIPPRDDRHYPLFYWRLVREKGDSAAAPSLPVVNATNGNVARSLGDGTGQKPDRCLYFGPTSTTTRLGVVKIRNCHRGPPGSNAESFWYTRYNQIKANSNGPPQCMTVSPRNVTLPDSTPALLVNHAACANVASQRWHWLRGNGYWSLATSPKLPAQCLFVGERRAFVVIDCEIAMTQLRGQYIYQTAQ